MKKAFLVLITFLFFVIGFYSALNSNEDLYSVERTRFILGTLVKIHVEDEDQENIENSIIAAFEEIEKIDSLFSTYNSSSFVTFINQGDDTLNNIPEEVFLLIKLSDEIWNTTGGNFDASLNKLIKTWGFESVPGKPDSNKILNALTNSGWGNIKLTGGNSLIRKYDVQLNFGGIAKGFAVDRAIDILKQSGIEKALINAGGEIKSYGHDYIIGIQHPRYENDIAVKLKLNEMSVATSGDYEKYFIEGGVRYHHILDPFSGYPARECMSVTIIAEDCAKADAFSTAVFVMGVKKGIQFIETLSNVEGLIIDSSGNIYTTSGYNRFRM